MVIQKIGARQNWKKEPTFLVLDIGNIVTIAVQKAVVRFLVVKFITILLLCRRSESVFHWSR